MTHLRSLDGFETIPLFPDFGGSDALVLLISIGMVIVCR
jgi:acyl-CoA synthetase (AMP-forming)/AMP-acid ligase II